jgi:glutamate synthase (NADPH/NADH) small chain
VRSVLHAEPRRHAGEHQDHRGRDRDRAHEEGWLKPQSPFEQDRQESRRDRFGPGRACLRAATRARRTRRACVREVRESRRLLRYGIPDFKMEKHYIDRRVAQMQAEGVTFHYGAHVGVNLAVADIVKSSMTRSCSRAAPKKAAIFQSRAAKSTAFTYAMEFLPQQNRRVGNESLNGAKDILAGGKHVVVIGGGDTGSDCIGTSIRQGAKSVTQLEIMPMPPEKENKLMVWPDWPLKMRTSSSQEEGAEREFSVMTQSFIGEGGKVKKLRCIRVDDNMKPIAGTEFDLDADLVLLAMGFVSPIHEGAVKDLGVELDQRGNVKANVVDYKSSKEKVFACGDLRRGQSLVVWAIREGRQAAHSVDKFLMGETNLPR